MKERTLGELSERESIVLEWAAQGYTDKEIAVRMQIAPGTVKTYWGRIRGKLNVANRAAAVAVARPFIGGPGLGIDHRPIEKTELWQAVLKVAPICMAVLDPTGNVIAASLPGSSCRFEIKAGSQLVAQLPAPHSDAVGRAIGTASETLELQNFDVLYDRSRPNPEAFRGTVSPVVSNGAVVALLVTFQNPGRHR